MPSEKPVDLYDDGTMRSGGSEHGTDDEPADQEDQNMEKEYKLHRKMLEAVGMYGTYLTEIYDKADPEGGRHEKG